MENNDENAVGDSCKSHNPDILLVVGDKICKDAGSSNPCAKPKDSPKLGWKGKTEEEGEKVGISWSGGEHRESKGKIGRLEGEENARDCNKFWSRHAYLVEPGKVERCKDAVDDNEAIRCPDDLLRNFFLVEIEEDANA